MKIEITETHEVEVKYLQVLAGVRYWEDSSVDGQEDTNGDLIPCRESDTWKPLIELETGKIINWKQGITADIHYKVCDDGVYQLLNEEKIIIKEIDGYVPTIMSPKSSGYGDYIIMDIDKDGIISNWNVDLNEFSEEED